MEDVFLGYLEIIQKVILAMFTTATLTLINFAALLDAIVAVHQAIQNAAGSVVLTKREAMCIIRMVGYRPTHSAGNTKFYVDLYMTCCIQMECAKKHCRIRFYVYLYMACCIQMECAKKHCRIRFGYRLHPSSKSQFQIQTSSTTIGSSGCTCNNDFLIKTLATTMTLLPSPKSQFQISTSSTITMITTETINNLD